MRNQIILMAVCFSLITRLYAQGHLTQEQTTVDVQSDHDTSYTEAAPHRQNYFAGLGIGIGEGLFFNGMMHMAVRFGGQAPWAQVDGDAIRDNFSEGPRFEKTDWFPINQIGHPYQGSYYFIAGRSNGLDFYSSVALTALGSFEWEFFGETNTPGLNDLITTTFGGAALGEMLHRLFLEASYPAAIVFSPFDSLNDGIYRRPKQHTKNIYELSAFTGIDVALTKRMQVGYDSTDEFKTGYLMNTAMNVVYGDPFYQESRVPYEHFELYARLSGGLENYDSRIISDAYLFSFTPLENLTTGFTMQFDFFAGRNIDFASQGFDWTVKLRKNIRESLSLEFRGHLGWTLLGVANFYDAGTWGEEFHNYSTGINGKFFLSLIHPRIGTFNLSALLYSVFVFPNSVPDSEGMTFFTFLDANYLFPMGKNISVGIGDTFAVEYGRYKKVPGILKLTNNINIFCRWSFTEPQR
ncbi:MAG: DUF3943 domain-containing protein [Bacteroidales bacterium]|jgi:hypothetical protein|nr:DUF3943 domain-containing protein [Bacteroidales bacterium]